MGLLSTMLQVGQTMAYAHARGVIHRDLKPSNVMVGSFGEVQVMDWGLAKVLARGGASDDARAGLDVESAGETVIATARTGADSDLSRAGSVMGTPAYMAPEQARGELEAIDERADVFALGSMLCEILTGQPAFTGSGSAEMQRKASRGELDVAFARLDACEDDTELVALAKDCLAPERNNRPRNASAFVERLRGYLDSIEQRLRDAELERAAEAARAEQARRTASVERRARRLTAALAAAIVGMLALGGGGYGWIQHQHAEQRARTAAAVNEALAEAERLRAEAQVAPPDEVGEWGEALSAARRAESLLAQGETDATTRARVTALLALIDRQQVEARDRSSRLAADRALLAHLESVRGDRAVHNDLKRADTEYAAAFRKAGLDFMSVGPSQAVQWIAARSEPVELAGYLDDWAFVSRRTTLTGRDDWRRLVAAARAADPDPWRDRLRTRLGATDEAALAELRRLADDGVALAAQPAASQVLLARELRDSGVTEDKDRAERVLHLAATRHPEDFWAHFELARIWFADGMSFTKPEQAVVHLTAATAIRPSSASAHHNLGLALKAQGKFDEAAAELREALRLKPDSSWVQLALYEMLEALGQLDKEIAVCRNSVRLHPEDAWAHAALAGALKAQGVLDSAMLEFREAIRLKPDMLLAHVELGGCLFRQRKFAEASISWRDAVRLNPDDPIMQVNLGITLAAQKKFTEAEAAYREAIRLMPDLVVAHNNLVSVLSQQGKHTEAAAAYRDAIRMVPNALTQSLAPPMIGD